MIKFNYKLLILLFIALLFAVFSTALINVYLNSKFKEDTINELMQKNFQDSSTFVQEFEKESIKNVKNDMLNYALLLGNEVAKNIEEDKISITITSFLSSNSYIRAVCVDSEILSECKTREKTQRFNNPKNDFAEYDFIEKNRANARILIFYDTTPIFLSSSNYSKITLENANKYNVEIQTKLRENDKNLKTILLISSLFMILVISSLAYLFINEISKKTKKLQESQNMLLVSSRFSAMGEMIGNIAHQWRQPLNIILSSITKIPVYRSLGKLNDKIIDESVENISKQVKYLSQTIDDFREFYKKDIEDEFLLNDSILAATSLIAATFQNNFITLETNLDQKNPTITGSKSKLIQVYINILNNAKDILTMSESRERFVLISTQIEQKVAKIYIFDSGGGVKREEHFKIFEPYFTTKEAKHGSGLGLYMSKQIVEKQLHGIISVKNSSFTIDAREHYGACFEIELPTL